VTRRCFRRLASALVVSLVVTGAFVRAQAPAAPDAAARLAQVRAKIMASPNGLIDAVPELRAILAIDPNLAEAHLLLGVAYHAAGGEVMIGDAKAELQQAIALDPGLVAARLVLTQVYFDLGRYDSARDEATTALRIVPGQGQFLAVLAEAERNLGNPERALALSNLAIEADPMLPQARYYRGLALIDAGRRDEGITQLQDVVGAGFTAPDLYLRLGAALTSAARYDEAIAALTAGVRLAPAVREFHIELARAHRLEGSLAAADQELNQATATPANVQVTPAFQRIEMRLSRERGLLRLKQARLPAAAEALQAALDIEPDDAASHQALAEVYLRQGLLAKARAEAATAASLGAPLADALQRRLGTPPAAPAAKGQP
jgi:tetratricopeptide (TPR) repeat protein